MKWVKLVAVALTLSLIGCEKSAPESETKHLLVYCGITMIKPMTQLAYEFEQQFPVAITFSQGGSQDLYDSLKSSQVGDLYLPGSSSYRTNNLADGLLGDYVHVGYNRIAIMVQKGNPKQLGNEMAQFIDPDIVSVLGNPDTGSVGRATYQTLKAAGIAEQAYDNAVYLTTDSRRLVQGLKEKNFDITLNWYASGTWPGHREYVDIIPLSDEFAKPKALQLSYLNLSKEPAMAKAFMQFVASSRGLQVFKEYGFLTEAEYQTALQGH